MRWLLIFVFSMSAATCGQKGPLVLPEDVQATALTIVQ